MRARSRNNLQTWGNIDPAFRYFGLNIRSRQVRLNKNYPAWIALRAVAHNCPLLGRDYFMIGFGEI